MAKDPDDEARVAKLIENWLPVPPPKWEKGKGLKPKPSPGSDDVRLALDLLDGYPAKPRWYERRYMESGSAREKEARAALARLLRSDAPLSPIIRRYLASLFDVADSDQTRELVFKKRTAGVQPQPRRDALLFSYIANVVDEGWKLEAAVQEAADTFGVDRSTAFRIWQEQGRRMVQKAADDHGVDYSTALRSWREYIQSKSRGRRGLK